MQTARILSLSAACVLLLAAVVPAHAQEKPDVSLKKDMVFINGKAVMKYEKSGMGTICSFYPLNDDTEILVYQYKNNETSDYHDDDYIVLNFLSAKKKVETTDRTHIGLGSMEKLMEWLLKEKVFNENGELNPERLELFSEKYHENILNRTVR